MCKIYCQVKIYKNTWNTMYSQRVENNYTLSKNILKYFMYSLSAKWWHIIISKYTKILNTLDTEYD